MFRIRIRRIRKFLGLLDPDPDTCIKVRKTFISTSLWLFIFEEWWKCTFKKYGTKQKINKNNFMLAYWRSPVKRARFGAGTGTVSQRFGSGSVLKCHGSGTLANTPEDSSLQTQASNKLPALFWVTETNINTWIPRKIVNRGQSYQISKKIH